MAKRKILSKKEELANAITHGIGFGLAVTALVILIIYAAKHGTAQHIAGVCIYGATLVIMYLASTLYHSFPEGKAKRVFRILDHSSIFLLIAGTYTPFTIIALQGSLGWAIFFTIWILALAGITYKVFWINHSEIFPVILYVVMGWMIIIAINPMMEALSRFTLILLISGGLFYTVGIFFYALQKMKYSHTIWHLFVMAGSICHFFTIFMILPGRNIP